MSITARVIELKGEKAEIFRTALKSSRVKKAAVLKAKKAIKESQIVCKCSSPTSQIKF